MLTGKANWFFSYYFIFLAYNIIIFQYILWTSSTYALCSTTYGANLLGFIILCRENVLNPKNSKVGTWKTFIGLKIRQCSQSLSVTIVSFSFIIWPAKLYHSLKYLFKCSEYNILLLFIFMHLFAIQC